MVKKGKEKGVASASTAKTPATKTPAKKASAAKKAAPPEDDLLIFTTDKKKKGGPSTAAEEGPPEPPKPTVKQIIGGQSWTGKLPVNLLSEHCQKMKWERPDYHQVRVVPQPHERLSCSSRGAGGNHGIRHSWGATLCQAVVGWHRCETTLRVGIRRSGWLSPNVNNLYEELPLQAIL